MPDRYPGVLNLIGAGNGGVALHLFCLAEHVLGEGILHEGAQVLGRVDAFPCEQKTHQILFEVTRPLVAVARLLREGLEQDLLEPRRNAGVEEPRRGDIRIADFLEGAVVRLADEELLPGEHLVEDDAHRKDVAPAVGRETTDLFGAHVAELALENSRLGLLRPVRRLGDTKVDDLHLAVVGDEDVLRRHIPVDNVELHPPRIPFAVRVVEPLGNLRRQVHRLGGGHDLLAAPVAFKQGPDIPPRHVLHGNEERALVLPELVDVHDVRVVQLNADSRLIDEHGDELFVLRHRGENPLDGEDPFEPLHTKGLGNEDLGHAAHVHPLEEKVFSEDDGLFHRGQEGTRATRGPGLADARDQRSSGSVEGSILGRQPPNLGQSRLLTEKTAGNGEGRVAFRPL